MSTAERSSLPAVCSTTCVEQSRSSAWGLKATEVPTNRATVVSFFPSPTKAHCSAHAQVLAEELDDLPLVRVVGGHDIPVEDRPVCRPEVLCRRETVMDLVVHREAVGHGLEPPGDDGNLHAGTLEGPKGLTRKSTGLTTSSIPCAQARAPGPQDHTPPTTPPIIPQKGKLRDWCDV